MSFLDAFEGYDKPYRLTLKHPATGEPIADADGNPAYISVYAANSLVAQDWKKARYARRRRTPRKTTSRNCPTMRPRQRARPIMRP